MKNILLLILPSVVLTSCSKYAQVYNVSPSNKEISLDNNHYFYYENDTIKIAYSFWASLGIMSFYVANKYSKPIYIDIKKCSFIANGNKHDYYEDKVTSNSIATGLSYTDIFGRHIGIAAGNGKSVKNERIMFIPPNSGVVFNTYTLSDNIAAINDLKTFKKDIKSTGIHTQKNEPNGKSFLTFRNYITYSTTENFTQEQYIDNGFYVSSVDWVKTKKFGTLKGEGKKAQYEYYLMSPDHFYYFPLSTRQLK